MKILYFSKDYTTHDWQYLYSLVSAGYRVTYVRLLNGPIFIETRMLPDAVEVVPWTGGQKTLWPWAWPRLSRSFRDLLQVVSPDLVHAGPIQSCGFIAAWAGARPLVVMSWGSDVLVEADRNVITRWIARYTLERADVVIGDCRAVREKVRVLADVADDRIVTYPWGIDLNVFSPRQSSLDLRKRLGWEECRVFLSTRSWEPQYRIETLIDAFRIVVRERKDARLLLLGSGSMAPRLRKLITQSALEDCICLLGQVPQEVLPDYYNDADVFVSSVPSDGTSISLLEAMACGLPVIVADAPGNREWVIPGENGWLFEVGSVQALADAMFASLEPTAPISAMREANLAVARSRADWRQNFEALKSAYSQALYSYRGSVQNQPGQSANMK